MQIDGCVFDLAMTEEHLDGAQVGARFEQMGCKTMAQRVRTDPLGDPRALRGLLASFPRNLGRDGNIRSPVLHRAGKQILLRLHPAPVDTEGFQQLLAQGNVTVLSAFPLANAHHHPLAVDIGDLQATQFRPPDTRRVQGHEHGAVEKVTGRVDQPRDFLRT
jgi:hypothetical protein